MQSLHIVNGVGSSSCLGGDNPTVKGGPYSGLRGSQGVALRLSRMILVSMVFFMSSVGACERIRQM
jgi:hypothetical protein